MFIAFTEWDHPVLVRNRWAIRCKKTPNPFKDGMGWDCSPIISSSNPNSSIPARRYLPGRLGVTIALQLPPPSLRGGDGNSLQAFISNVHLPPFSLGALAKQWEKSGQANLLPACFLLPSPRDGGSRQVALRALSLPAPKVQEAQGDRREFLALLFRDIVN